jgi:membrane-associated phospholipid phosphatase
MNTILSWGLELVRGFQGLASPALTIVMKGFSFMGTELGFLALVPIVYWCVDRRRGMRMGTLLLFATAINLRLKLLFAQPRPYDLDPSVGMAKEHTFGLPSNHAMTSAVLGGTAAPLFRRPLGLVIAVAFPLLVGLSRIYLGVHFPTDVLAGWAIGAAFVGLDAYLGDRVERFMAGLRDSIALAAVAAATICVNFLTQTETALSGTFFGFAGAAIYARKSAPFSAESGGRGRKALRYLVGMASLAIVYALPKLLLSELEAGGPPLIRFLRYALVGAWASAGAPALFLKLGLAEREPQSASENDESVSSK